MDVPSIIQTALMRPRLRQFRAWLVRNGLSPKSKLAFMTWYLLGLDLLLFLVQTVAGVFRGSFGKSLGGWIIFLSLVVIVLFGVLAARWLSSRLLWRLRNRLLLTYISSGSFPWFCWSVLEVSLFISLPDSSPRLS